MELSLPQDCWGEKATVAEVEASICQSDLRGAEVELPAGMSLNPSSASGLSACSESQIGYKPGTAAPVEFDQQPPSCPDASKIGSVTIRTPLLSAPLNGSVYLARQGQNPFGSLLAMYVVAEGSGVLIKLAGKVESDPASGRLTANFTDQPQAPFEKLDLTLKSGPRAPLRTPAACGTYASHATLTGWSGKVAEAEPTFTIGQACGAGFDPHLDAGTENPLAGTTSPFSLRLTRADGSPALGGITATLPPGLTGYLKGIPYCPDAALAAVSGAEGSGAAEEASPACPAASQLGTVTAGAGAGPDPFFARSGRAYLAGPYKGAPLSLAAVVPAVAGPFDLGSVVVRNALRIDPETAQITAVSDPLPTILHGIPLDLRDVRVELDRLNFTLNPTSCEAMAIDATVTSVQGQTANPSVPFQVGGCDKLGFKPKLSLRLKGQTGRTGHPALRATLTMPQAGQSNIARATVSLPHSEFLAQSDIKTICTRVQYATGSGGGADCPKGSVYGHATAWSPLLDRPLSGPVYLRSSSHPLPDLVASLDGQIHIDLDGVVSANKKTHGLVTTFTSVPDAPVSRFVLAMPAGKHSLLENSTDICAGTHRAIVQMAAHDAALAASRPKLTVAGCGKGPGHRRKHR